MYSIIAISRYFDVLSYQIVSISLNHYVQDDDRLLLRKYIIMGIMRTNFMVMVI